MLCALRRDSAERSNLSMLDGERARWDFTDTLKGSAASNIASGQEIGLYLEVSSRVHPANDEVHVEVALTVRDATPRADAKAADPVVSTRALSWSARLPSGETFLLSGFLGIGKHRTGDARSGSTLESLLDFPDRRSGEIVLALTPRIVREPGFSESDLAELCIGTESTIELCGARWR